MAVPPTLGADAEVARRLHRELNARPARRGRTWLREEEAAVKEEAEAEEVKVRAVEWWPVKAEPEEEEEVKIRAVEWVGGEDGKRRRVKAEREVVVAGPSGRGAGGQQAGNAGRGTSRFRGVSKANRGKGAKPWVAHIKVTEDGKHRQIHIAHFAREEDAARAFDRVCIAKLGHAEAETNFPAAKYRAEWAELEELGVDRAAALMWEHAAAVRRGPVNKTSRFRGVTKLKRMKAKPWKAQISLTMDGKTRVISIALFGREEDAARAYDRVNIARLGHAEAETNFPAAEYRAEWAELEALGVEGAVARERRRARGEL